MAIPDDAEEKPIEQRPIREIWNALTIAQAWGFLGALSAIIVGSAAVGAWSSQIISTASRGRESYNETTTKPAQSAHSSEANLVACKQARDYPLGEWYLSGVAKNRNNTNEHYVPLGGVVRFTGEREGTSVTNEDKDPILFFTLTSGSLKQDPTVHLRGETKEGYWAEGDFVVSADGCRFGGEFKDSDGDFGTITYIWSGRQRFWVQNVP
jgi:hypothetical protein